MYLLAPISSRNELPKLLNEKNLTSVGVEVGCHRGIYTEIILALWKGEKLYCVDPWEDAESHGYDQEQAQYLAESDGDRRKDYKEFLKNTSRHKDKVEVIKGTSLQAYQQLWKANIRPDFVYLDGNHKPPHVEHDIRQWWYLLREGGVLAGHDIICPGDDGPDQWGRYIQPAIQHYFRNLTVYLITEPDGGNWSYYVVKSKS